MPKNSGGIYVREGVNNKLDMVANKIIEMLGENNINISLLPMDLNTEILLCDEEKRETVSLGINSDDKLIRIY